MVKKYIVRLTDEEREILCAAVKKLSGSSQKVRRVQILLKADANGPNWTGARIAEAFDCRWPTVETTRIRIVTEGFDIALNGKKRKTGMVHTSVTFFRSQKIIKPLPCMYFGDTTFAQSVTLILETLNLAPKSTTPAMAICFIDRPLKLSEILSCRGFHDLH